ncbi:hypothetical protein KGQ19_33205 [Catenulispora sp. NL8]|uniref:Uncharacterized protein n=1 Tax=Catenulispora pinistramenti TaxID=2705254 RepID=A0ABS5L079_9ACTN|nr:Rv3235 family protein [Catenulispora pinistramenti]MBS2551736.1 hypothetical protein [Catenulispora pinistramenti]
MVPVRAVGTAEVAARWRHDNRPDFPGIAVWVDAVAEVEIDPGVFAPYNDWPVGLGDELPEEPGDGRSVPWAVDAWSSEYGKVWRPLSGSGREPRPGLLLSVVRAGVVMACPTPLPDPPTGALARALSRVELAERRPAVLPVQAQPAPAPRRTPPQKAYNEVRALVGVLVEVMVGRRTATHAASWTAPEVRGKLRTPRYARTASLKSVRLSESGDGVEALALLRDGARTRAVALRFDRAEDARWRCTALQPG